MSLGVSEILLILVVVLVLFGGKKIPELARGLGKAQAEYKKAKEAFENEVSDFKAAVDSAAKEEIKKKAPVAKKDAVKKETKKSAPAVKKAGKTAAKKTTK